MKHICFKLITVVQHLCHYYVQKFQLAKSILYGGWFLTFIIIDIWAIMVQRGQQIFFIDIQIGRILYQSFPHMPRWQKFTNFHKLLIFSFLLFCKGSKKNWRVGKMGICVNDQMPVRFVVTKKLDPVPVEMFDIDFQSRFKTSNDELKPLTLARTLVSVCYNWNETS